MQLVNCTSQMTELLHGLTPALAQVTTLKLRCRKTDPASTDINTSMPNTDSHDLNCLDVMSTIAGSLCKLLGAATPSLINLQVEGCCGAATFQAMGACCQQLTFLQIDASSVPISTMISLHRNVPSLRCLTLRASQVQRSIHELGDYVGACLQALRDSTSLTEMVLDFDPQLQVQCMQGKWDQVPPKLSTLVCACGVNQLENAESLLSSLDSLSLSTTSGSVALFSILTRARHLKQLSVTGPAKLLLHCDQRARPFGDLPLLRDRLLNGLKFDVPLIRLWGPGKAVADVLADMPTLSSVCSCTLRYSNTAEPPNMTHIARVFPNLTELHLLGSPNARMKLGMEVLGPLADCASLKHLRMCMPSTLSTLELAELCMSIPILERLAYSKCDGVELRQLKETFAMQGQQIVVESNTYGYSDDFDC